LQRKSIRPSRGVAASPHRTADCAGVHLGLVVSGSALDFWLITVIGLALGALLIIPVGGADMGRDLDAELLFRLDPRRHRLHARQLGADHHRCDGGAILSYIDDLRHAGVQVEKNCTAMFIKRPLASSGYAGIDNPLFYRDNTTMLPGETRRSGVKIWTPTRDQITN
jgi:hypothetical protein